MKKVALLLLLLSFSAFADTPTPAPTPDNNTCKVIIHSDGTRDWVCIPGGSTYP